MGGCETLSKRGCEHTGNVGLILNLLIEIILESVDSIVYYLFSFSCGKILSCDLLAKAIIFCYK